MTIKQEFGDKTINFKAPSSNSRKFNSEVKLRGLKNKDLFNKFIEIFLEEPETTLKFLGISEG